MPRLPLDFLSVGGLGCSAGESAGTHIDDFIASLEAAGRTEKHIEVSRAQLERLKDGCNLKTIDDPDPRSCASG